VEYHVNYDPANYQPWKEDECIELKGCEIDWKPGRDVTVLTKKVQTNRIAKKGSSNMTKQQVPRESFFRILSRTLKVGDKLPEDLRPESIGSPDEADPDDDRVNDKLVKECLDEMFSIGYCLSRMVIPYAVRYYAGEIGEDDEDEEEQEGSDNDEEVFHSQFSRANFND